MTVSLQEFAGLAAAVGVHFPACLLYRGRCEKCGGIFDRDLQLEQIDIFSTSEVSRLVGSLEEEVTQSTCVHCLARARTRLLEVRFWSYSESVHLVFERRLVVYPGADSPEFIDTFFDLEGRALEMLEVDREAFLRAARFDATLRNLIANQDLHELGRLAETSRSTIVARERALLLLRLGHISAAELAFSALTQAPAEHPRVKFARAALLELQTQHGTAADLYKQLFSNGERSALLPLARSLERTGRVHELRLLVEQANAEFRELAPLALARCKCRLNSAENTGKWVSSFEYLAKTARNQGSRSHEQIAAAWLEFLEIGVPDWDLRLSAADYIDLLAGELSAAGYDVTREPAFETENGSWQLSLLAKNEARSWGILVVEQCENPAEIHTAEFFIRNARQSLELGSCFVLSRRPIPWTVIRACAPTPESKLCLHAEADFTLQLPHVNSETLVAGTSELFGIELSGRWSDLPKLQALIRRVSDEGFCEPGFALGCQIASHLEIMLRHRGLFGGWNLNSPSFAPPSATGAHGQIFEIFRWIAATALLDAEFAPALARDADTDPESDDPQLLH